MFPLQFFYQRILDTLSKQLTCVYLLKFAFMPNSVLSASIALGIVSITLLETNFSSAIAQITIPTEQKLSSEETTSQVNLLFVNSGFGNDQTGNGSENAPFQTITQALRSAQPNTIIKVAPGTYSQQTGEKFPLILKPGVAIQGDSQDKGKNVKILGGGDYLSRSFGRQNIAIVSANNSSLSGVTVTNTNFRGYGLWIEFANTTVQDSTFTGNTQDGIFIIGNSTPTVSRNYIYSNGANGITTAGDSRPQIQENVIQGTGFGINIVDNAAPIIASNQIIANRSGVVIQANTSPVLRNNIIQNSTEDGLVIIAQATPDLGNSQEMGSNKFDNNRRYDINAKAAKQVVYAFGNQINQNQIAGNIDTTSGTAIARNSLPGAVSTETTPANGEIVFSAPNIPQNLNSLPRIISNSGNITQTDQLPQLAAATLQSPVVTNNSQPPENETEYTPQLNYVRIQPTVETAEVNEPRVIEFVAPQLQNNQPSNLVPRTPPTARPVVLGNSRSVSFPREYAVRPSGSYRVIVNVANDAQREIVRSLVPDAFPRVVQGRRVMQAGVFSNEVNAMQMVQILNSKGLRATVSY
ncbi:MAG: DUF1565 domain-containing protein [Nostocales cyanobacterium]|nr:MAG: DUF1565 domain-containing protein [Nostocales cyanobacterium]TAF11149.1 MAG: DUF1565 domain-containing protein [Nostocales cyanobacterium]